MKKSRKNNYGNIHKFKNLNKTAKKKIFKKIRKTADSVLFSSIAFFLRTTNITKHHSKRLYAALAVELCSHDMCEYAMYDEIMPSASGTLTFRLCKY